jgi:hypothetical protein
MRPKYIVPTTTNPVRLEKRVLRDWDFDTHPTLVFALLLALLSIGRERRRAYLAKKVDAIAEAAARTERRTRKRYRAMYRECGYSKFKKDSKPTPEQRARLYKEAIGDVMRRARIQAETDFTRKPPRSFGFYVSGRELLRRANLPLAHHPHLDALLAPLMLPTAGRDAPIMACEHVGTKRKIKLRGSWLYPQKSYSHLPQVQLPTRSRTAMYLFNRLFETGLWTWANDERTPVELASIA